MKIQIERKGQIQDVKNIKIILNKDVSFKISVNNLGELEINKTGFDDGDIKIRPNYANQISIS